MAYYSFLRPLWAFLGRIDFDHHAINIDASQFGMLQKICPDTPSHVWFSCPFLFEQPTG